MIERNASPRLRAQFFATLVGFTVLGGLSGLTGTRTLAKVLNQSAANAPMIEFRPLYVTGLPLAVAFFALTLLALLPKRKARSSGKGLDPARMVFGLVVLCLLLAVITPSIARFALEGVLTGRGYNACPPSETERRPPARWAMSDGVCAVRAATVG